MTKKFTEFSKKNFGENKLSCARVRVIMEIMKRKKIVGLMLALATTTSVFLGALPLSAQADVLDSPPAAEETSPVVFDTDNAELHLPISYEQYLPLESPSHIAMNEEYIAIADNTSIYIYNKSENEYTRYDHKSPAGQPTAVSKIQFSDAGEMFFRDAGSLLYRYRFDTNTAETINNVPCQTFLIHGDYLYFVNETPAQSRSDFYYVPVGREELNENNVESLTDENGVPASNPRIAYENDTLYFIFNNNEVWAYDGTTHERIRSYQLDVYHQITNLQFVCAYGDALYYTAKIAGDTKIRLWRTDLSGEAEYISKDDEDDYSTITSYGGYLYCIQGKVIREMKVVGDGVEPTGYEISSDSSSPHRLNNSGEIVRTKDLVAVADTDNKRVSLYNRLTDTYTVIPCVDENGNSFTPEHIAIDREDTESNADYDGEEWLNGNVETDNKIAVSCGDKIYECVYVRHTNPLDGYPKPIQFREKRVQGSVNVKGLCYVYGECYYITEFGYGIFSDPSAEEKHFASGYSSPDVITSDVYGAIYVAFGNSVYAFGEDDFKGTGASGTKVAELSDLADKIYTSLSVDYEGNVWFLSKDGTLECNKGEENQTMALIDGKDFVYLNEDSASPASFALSYEDDEIYFNFKNYVVKTDAYALDSLPALNKITAGDAQQRTFALADTEKLFVEIPAHAVGFQINLDKLKTGESAYFPYETYFRTNETLRGVLLCEPEDDEDFYVVALYDAETWSFTANIFHKSKSDIAISEGHYDEDEKDGTRYVSSGVPLSSAPCLFASAKDELPALALIRLNRGDKVRVLGTAKGVDKDYALVEVITTARESVTGYVPVYFLSKTDPLGVKRENYKLGYLKGGTGVVLYGENGEELNVEKRMQAKLYDNGDGTYTAVVEKDGVLYTGIVTKNDVSFGETDALRISLIIVLSVLALVIVGGYAFLMFPRKKKRTIPH